MSDSEIWAYVRKLEDRIAALEERLHDHEQTIPHAESQA